MPITTDSAARKQAPVHSGFLAYFPDAIAEVARLSKAGNDKHNPGEPLHWSRGKSNDHADCIARHQLEWDQIDTDGFYHAVKVAWRAMAQLQVLLETQAAEPAQFSLDLDQVKAGVPAEPAPWAMPDLVPLYEGRLVPRP